MKQTLLALYALIALLSPRLAIATCDDEATRWPAHFVSLMKKGLEVRALDLNDLKALAENREWLCPYASKVTRPENLALRQATDRSFQKLKSEKDRAKVRLSLAELIRETELSEQQVGESKIKTQNVLAPKVLTPFGIEWPSKLNHSSVTPRGGIVQGTFDSRPVFLTSYEDNRNSSAAVFNLLLFDPFHPDASQRVSTIIASQPKKSISAFGFVERDGKTYVQVHNPLRSFDLATKEEVQIEIDHDILFKVMRVGDRKFQVRLLPDSTIIVRENGKPDWTYPKISERRRDDLTVFTINSRIYVGFSEWHIDEQSDSRPTELFRVDLETKETVQTSELTPPYEFNHWQPIHPAYNFKEGQSYIVAENIVRWNWQTMSAEPLFETRGMVHYLEYDNREYILMGQRLIQADSGSETTQLTIPGNNTFVSFTYKDELYAVGFNYTTYPVMIKFTTASP